MTYTLAQELLKNSEISAENKIQRLQYLIQEDKTLLTQTDPELKTNLLFDATLNCNGDAVAKYLISQHPKLIEGRSRAGTNPLFYAAKHANIALFDWLMSEYSRLFNEVNNHGKTVLHFLCMHKDALPIIKKYITPNNIQSLFKPDQYTNRNLPTHNAALFDCPKTNEYLLKNHNLDINYLNNNGAHVIHRAAQKGHTETITYLVSTLNIDVNLKSDNKWGSTAFEISCDNGHLATAKELVKLKADTNYFNKKGRHAVHSAAKHGHTEIITYLVKQLNIDVDLKQKNERESTAFIIACVTDHLATIKELVELKADTKHFNKKGWHAIHYAAENGHIETITYLVRTLNIDVNLTCNNEWGQTPFYIACANEHLNTAKELVKLKADTKHVNKNGWHAIHYAAENGHDAIIKFLITQLDIDPSIENFKNKITPLQLAINKAQINSVMMLLNCGALFKLGNHVQKTITCFKEGKDLTYNELPEFLKIDDKKTQVIARILDEYNATSDEATYRLIDFSIFCIIYLMNNEKKHKNVQIQNKLMNHFSVFCKTKQAIVITYLKENHSSVDRMISRITDQSNKEYLYDALFNFKPVKQLFFVIEQLSKINIEYICSHPVQKSLSQAYEKSIKHLFPTDRLKVIEKISGRIQRNGKSSLFSFTFTDSETTEKLNLLDSLLKENITCWREFSKRKRDHEANTHTIHDSSSYKKTRLELSL